MARLSPIQSTKQAESHVLEHNTLGTIQHSIAPTLGERLIPFLLLIGESCVGCAILLGMAFIKLAGDANPLVPIWGLPLVILSFYVTCKVFQRQPAISLVRKVVEPLVWFSLGFAFTFSFVWFASYAQTDSFFSFDWLLSLFKTFIPVTPENPNPTYEWSYLHVNISPAVQAVILLIIMGISGWRGYRLAQKHFISDDINRLFIWGGLVIVLVVGLFVLFFHTGETILSPQLPALLAATFCICVLTARALEHASYMRRFSRARLWGNAVRQEQIIGVVMGVLGLLAPLLAIFFGNATADHYTPSKGKKPKPLPVNGKPKLLHVSLLEIPFSFWIIIILFLLALVLGITGFLLWRRAKKLQNLQQRKSRRAKREKTSEKNSDELHETVFNWSLFFAQVRAALLALLAWLNPFRRRASRGKQARTIDDIVLAEPAVRSIREVYRALLKRAASRGQPRETDETPYEFRLRLHEREAAAGEELEAITEAYVLTRYGGNRPGKDEVARVKALWGELKQKWG